MFADLPPVVEPNLQGVWPDLPEPFLDLPDWPDLPGVGAGANATPSSPVTSKKRLRNASSSEDTQCSGLSADTTTTSKKRREGDVKLGSTAAVSVVESKERLDRKEKNRRSAAASRLRKKAAFEEMQLKVRELEMELALLRSENATLRNLASLASLNTSARWRGVEGGQPAEHIVDFPPLESPPYHPLPSRRSPSRRSPSLEFLELFEYIHFDLLLPPRRGCCVPLLALSSLSILDAATSLCPLPPPTTTHTPSRGRAASFCSAPAASATVVSFPPRPPLLLEKRGARREKKYQPNKDPVRLFGRPAREERTTVVCAESCSESETFAVWTGANDAPPP